MSKKLKRRLALIMCLVFVMSVFAAPVSADKGGGGKPAPEPAEAMISGKVTISGTKTGIPDAVVTASGETGAFSAVSAGKGTYSLGLPEGTYTVTCEAAGYNTAGEQVTTKNGTTTTLNFSLNEAMETTGIISGTVIDSTTGTPLDGAVFTVSEGGYSAVTGNDGKFTITGVIAGTYQVSVSADGHVSSEQQVAVEPGAESVCDFALAPSGTVVSIVYLAASQTSFVENTADAVYLFAMIEGTPADYTWEQVSGPKVGLSAVDASNAVLDISGLSVAADVELVFQLTVSDTDGNSDSARVSIYVEPGDMFPFLGTYVQVGGATTAVNKFVSNGIDWSIFNIGSKLCAAPVGASAGPVNFVYVPGFVHDIDLVTYNGTNYALLSMGSEGIGVVDISDPYNMVLVNRVHVNYYQGGITFTEGGGAILYDNEISSVQAPIAALETDGATLFIADGGYGIHRTALDNLLAEGGPVLEPDGTLFIEAEKYTLQYAGENPWGGPLDLALYGDRLFACIGSLGLGIFDPASLEQVGRYNLYTDATVLEDWFVGMDPAQAVQRDSVTGEVYLDSFTGMPDYRQTSFEILQVMKQNLDAPTPWADFDRCGKFYYKAQSVDIAEINGRTIAYIAYSLGGLVAVDITGYREGAADNFFNASYLGYVPAVPANGPKEPTGEQSESLLPYFGAGMLKESGIVDVQVRGDYVYITDHFAGLVIVDNASAPEMGWHGPDGPYNNDTDGIMGNHWPDSEFITSYNMSPYDPNDNESLPAWMYESPCLLATAEINGHGNSLLLMDEMSVDTAGNVDLLECAGGGGFNYVDIVDLNAPVMEERYSVPVYFPPTDEIGAAADSTPTQTISIGHSQGVAASDTYLYVSDGPHGITAWKLVDEEGFATDDIHLVANTLQDEYPEIVNGVKIYPASHATNVIYDPVNHVAWSGSASLGLRRVNVSDVEAGHGQIGTPLLLPLALTDCFEHNAEWGTVRDVQFQDHAYDVAIKGNYAFAADGSNGLTVYDYTKDSTDPGSGFLVSNLGAGAEKPPLGTASGIALWTDPADGRSYAFIACGPRGVGVVDITDVSNMKLIKVFEPVKYEDDKVGAADGQATDVKVAGSRAYFTYDSFGVVCYDIYDLIEALPDGVSPTDVWKKNQSGVLLYDYRPEAVSRFKLQYVPGYEDWAGGAFKMDYTEVNGKLVFYVAFAEAGVLKINWTDPANPVLEEVAPTVGECTAVVVSNGRVYAADGSGGLVFFK
ncbi:MAG: hypothetical protein CVU89_04815 [Firmicutes bacterium HGW-Firmicutes-14]|nr:MAG: hypothetical protein CVU89_04815 [Firmicutes bacterium HGW-Firmicutes-14]